MNIVAVDHEPTTLEDLTKKLRTVFPTSIIKGFNNPIEPLQYAQSNKIDMLFTDVRLRPFDGYELIKILGQTQSFYSYVVSGSKEHPDDLRWMKVTGTFSKPITTTELTQIRDGILKDAPEKERHPAPEAAHAQKAAEHNKPEAAHTQKAAETAHKSKEGKSL